MSTLHFQLPGHRARRGSNAVEFAITAIPLFTLLLGIAEYGLFLGQTIDMVECAQAGAREAAVATADILDANGTDTDIEDEGITACQDTQTVKGYGGGTCTAAIVDVANLGRSIQVTATDTYTSISSGLIPIPANTTYTATYRLIP